MKIYIKTFVLFLALFVFPKSAFSRHAELNESEVIYKSIDVNKKINKNGTYKLEYSSLIEIKKESARTEYGLYRFQFNPISESLDYIEARTINGKKFFPVKKSDIVIKPLSHNGPGFDTKNQVTIAYSNVEVGSQLELKYRLTRKIASIPNLFSEHFKIGTDSIIENYKISWVSKEALQFEAYDPDKYFDVSQINNKEENKIEIQLKRPLFLKIIEEKDSIYSPQSLIWFGISSLKSWSDFPRPAIKYYEKIISSELPKKFEDIQKAAANIKDQIEQINFVTSQLAKNLRYLGDWRLVKGAYYPHTLEQIAKSGYGDCKDMSVSAASILKKLGYTVHAAFINRGSNIIRSPIKLAALYFDHAIVWAEKDGHTFWVDPTNFTSYVQRVYPDIADRDALILDPEGARLTKTPPNDFMSNVIQSELNLNFDDSNILSGSGKIQLSGYGSHSITGRGLSSSKSEIDHTIIKWATSIPDLLEWKFEDYDLSSRIIKDFATQYTFKARWQPITTSAGMGYLVSSRDIIRVINIPLHNRFASLVMIDPFHYDSRINFQGNNLYINKNVSCEGSSKWFEYRRDLKKENQKIILQDKLSIKQHTINIEELKTPAFYQEQQKILSCMGDFAVVFK